VLLVVYGIYTSILLVTQHAQSITLQTNKSVVSTGQSLALIESVKDIQHTRTRIAANYIWQLGEYSHITKKTSVLNPSKAKLLINTHDFADNFDTIMFASRNFEFAHDGKTYTRERDIKFKRPGIYLLQTRWTLNNHQVLYSNYAIVLVTID
jgi:hypothetical protein